MTIRKTALVISMAAVCIGLLCATAVIVVCRQGLFEKDAQPTDTSIQESATTRRTTTAATTTEAASPVTSPTAPSPLQSTVLTALLEARSLSFEDLAQQQCTQLVAVDTQGSVPTIRFFQCDEGGRWSEAPSMACEGFVGYNGVTESKREGDGATPLGLYAIGQAFYQEHAPNTALDTFVITSDTYWVDDVDSAYYNQLVESPVDRDWTSAEHMIDYEEYAYGFVIDYNTQRVPHAGSAIFFHVGSNATAGCIATSETFVLAYLARLDAARCPHILIV